MLKQRRLYYTNLSIGLLLTLLHYSRAGKGLENAVQVTLRRSGSHHTYPASLSVFQSSQPSGPNALESTFTCLELREIAQLFFPEFPTAFFLTFFPLRDSQYVSFRTSPTSSETVVMKLDEKLQVLGEVRRLQDVEDARVIEYKGEGWLVDNHYRKPRTLVIP